jgi:hypothetical protein
VRTLEPFRASTEQPGGIIKSYWGSGRRVTIVFVLLALVSIVLVAAGVIPFFSGAFIVPALALVRCVVFQFFDR